MGPLWAWVGFWLLSLYGLVFLLRSAMARSVVEPVPVLVATPKATEEALPEPVAQAAEPEAAMGGGEELVATVPEGLAVETGNSVLAPAEEVPEPEDGLTPLAPEPEEPSLEAALSQGADVEPGAADFPEVLDEPETVGQTLGEDPAESGLAPPASEELEPLDPGIPEAPLAGEPEALDTGSLEVPEGEAPQTLGQGSLEALGTEEPASLVQELPEAPVNGEVDMPDEVAMGEDEPVVYRAIDLESLTLGLQASEIQERYGAPGHMAKLGEDGEQWRYPLNATDDRGQGLEGVLVLEFQRGRLVRKALEEAGEA